MTLLSQLKRLRELRDIEIPDNDQMREIRKLDEIVLRIRNLDALIAAVERWQFHRQHSWDLTCIDADSPEDLDAKTDAAIDAARANASIDKGRAG